MTHYSQVSHAAFLKIKNGDKIIEPRLNDDAHRRIKLGDLIMLKDRTTDAELLVKVVGVLRYKTFAELFAAFPVKHFGAEAPGFAEQEVRQWYSTEAETAHGVLGIKLHILSKD